ncbi:hypothetical protein IPA_03940 [Ignicoccus pacificus DSM 13166]|uniref:DUF763 domain-containing protein n=1 Tax=Ignicoccus pacificus DSM 13166 TaxID=940294 RepID=A0A977PKL8_9CREN|nr:hypothetical protein IPA_03940 [Ignicoccus pacificus DSM 13166]
MEGGISDLILHGGKVPPHLMKRMIGLSEVIVDLMVEEFGPEEVVRRLSDPFWFQAFNNAIGMDWDSSGSTAVVLGILKRLSWEKEWEFLVLGGKGKNMLKVKEEAEEAGKKLDIAPEEVFQFSKSSARLDSALLQDGYDLYVHFVVLSRKRWTVVQQGMNVERKLARRYHLTDENRPWRNPHSAVSGIRGEALDASAPVAEKMAEISVDLINEGPSRVMTLLKVARAGLKGQRRLTGEFVIDPRAIRYYYPVRPSRQLENALKKAYEFKPSRKEDLLVAPGIGPKTVRALALISHLIYGYSPSFEDPVSSPLDPFAYAYAVGGKDGVPYPYDVKTADKVIEIMKEIVMKAKIGEKEKAKALARLGKLAERLKRGT